MTFSFPTPRPLTTYTPVSGRATNPSLNVRSAHGRRQARSSRTRCVPLLLEMGRRERRGLNLACEKTLQSCSDEI